MIKIIESSSKLIPLGKYPFKYADQKQSYGELDKIILPNGKKIDPLVYINDEISVAVYGDIDDQRDCRVSVWNEATGEGDDSDIMSYDDAIKLANKAISDLEAGKGIEEIKLENRKQIKKEAKSNQRPMTQKWTLEDQYEICPPENGEYYDMGDEKNFIASLPEYPGWEIEYSGFDDDGVAYIPANIDEDVLDEYDGQIFICPPGGFDSNEVFFGMIGAGQYDDIECDNFEEARQHIKKILIDDGHKDIADTL